MDQEFSVTDISRRARVGDRIGRVHIVLWSIFFTAQYVWFDESVRRQATLARCIFQKSFHRKEMTVERNIFPKLLLNQQCVTEQEWSAVVDAPADTGLFQQVVDRRRLIQQEADIPWVIAGFPRIVDMPR